MESLRQWVSQGRKERDQRPHEFAVAAISQLSPTQKDEAAVYGLASLAAQDEIIDEATSVE